MKRPAINVDLAIGELCRRKLSYFVREMWDTIISDELVWSWHMEAICDEIQEAYERVFTRYELPDGRITADAREAAKHKEAKNVGRLPKEHDIIINVPPGSSKSTIATIMAPAWSWTRDAGLRHITASYADKLATQHAVKSRDVIRSDKYRRYFPEVEIKKDEDNKTDYKSTRNGQRYATSVGGTVTGVHAHIITLDDIINPKEAATEVGIANANEWLDTTINTRKVDKAVTVTILIMQRLASNDPTGHLIEKKGDLIHHVCLPATIGPQVSPAKYRNKYVNGYLDPERMGPEVLAESKKDLRAAGYAGQFDQLPAPAGGLTWKKWFIPVPDEYFPRKEILQQYGSDWDLAYTSDEENAASAYVTAGKLTGRIYIDDLDWKWLEFPDMINWMKTKRGPHYIEAKASGKSAKQTLVQQGVVAIEVQVKGGSDKVARANMATPVAEAGMVYVRASLLDRLYNDSRQGILAFPKGAFKDLADALAQSLQRLSAGGTVVIAGEEESVYDVTDELDY